MNQGASKRNTWLFIGFLLLGGIFHYFDPTENLALNSFLFSGRFAIFAGLVLFWIRSVRSRLLPTRVRTYMTAAGILMLSLLVIQVFSTRIVGDSVDPAWVSRYSKYAYWIPQMLIPALFLMACVRIRRGGQDGDGWDERLLMIPALFLSLMMLTNDLHHLVYRPKAEYPELMIVTGRYTHGAGFYLLYAWMILACVIGDKLFLNEVLVFFSREQQDVYTPAAPTAEIPTEAWRGYWVCAYVDVDGTAYPASLLNDKTDLYVEGTSAILGGPVLCDIQVKMESADGALTCEADGAAVALQMQEDGFLRMTLTVDGEDLVWYLLPADMAV